MNVRNLAAGFICAGFEQADFDAALLNSLRALKLAGVILFARNVRSVHQTRALTDAVRTAFEGADPILAIDQEGGRVARIREGTVEIPSMMAVAATGDPQLARRAGAQTAHDLRRIGINVDFAPVLDLALHRGNTVIGARAFGDDPQRVAEFAGSFGAGLEGAGVVATYKHFPGHGSTATDSHLALPVIDVDEATLRERDLAPFAALLPSARAVMTAHIVVNAFDPERPATNAERLLTGLLRNEMRFAGVCFTDCMQMDAIAKTVGTAGGAVLALQAGADCILISHSFELAVEAIEAIEQSVRDEKLPLSRLQEAYGRVQSLRRGLQPPIDLDSPAPDPRIGVEIGRHAVTLVRGNSKAAADAAVVSFQSTTTEGVQGKHEVHASLTEFANGIAEFTLPLEPQPEQVDRMIASLETPRNAPIVLARRAHLYSQQARAIARILEGFPDALIVSVREPFDVECFPNARNLLATYGDDRPSMEGLAQVLFAGARPTGEFPVRWLAVR